jgi:N-acetylmuramoyl-L-alanine amidase
MRKIVKRWLYTMPLLIALSAAAIPLLAAGKGIVGLDVAHEGSRERVTLLSHSELSHKALFHLDNPHRLVVDFPKRHYPQLRLPDSYQGALIRGIRFGTYTRDTVRMVVDTHRKVRVLGSYAVAPTDNGGYWRYVLDIEGEEPRDNSAITAAKPKLPAKPMIVIDAGHGGKDPGAIGRNHTREKHVTLRYAKALQKALLKTGRYRVALTRDDDRYLFLKERVAIARENKGDLFISLHADSNQNADAQGFSVYTLSETASDEEAAALAAQENKADIIGGLDLNVEDEDVASILIDLTRRETLNKSSVFADMMIDALHPKITRLSNTHRYAGFRVLKAPDVPSVLVEIGFLSNRKDEKLLNTREYESLVSSSLVKALDHYFANQPRAL